MRIIAGQLKRKSIRAPQGHLTRPTTDRTRESLFHLVEARLALREAEVLDLFAGTGALGLEAISRGARFVTFVENERRVMQVARDNADTLDVSNQGRFVPGDAVHFLETYNGPPFDLIMADPPYDLDAMDRLPDLALPHVREGGLLTLEHDTRIFFDEHPHLDTSRPYGRTIVSVFRKST
jgi:16S rRNA (guanine(966)-N(2))-methyltransferase RsmD